GRLHAERIFRSREKGPHRHVRRRPGKKHGLVRRKKHRSRDFGVHPAPRRRASWAIHRLRSLCGRYSSLDGGLPEKTRKERRSRKRETVERSSENATACLLSYRAG